MGWKDTLTGKGKGPYWKRGSFRNPDGSEVGKTSCVLMLAVWVVAVAALITYVG